MKFKYDNMRAIVKKIQPQILLDITNSPRFCVADKGWKLIVPYRGSDALFRHVLEGKKLGIFAIRKETRRIEDPAIRERIGILALQ